MIRPGSAAVSVRFVESGFSRILKPLRPLRVTSGMSQQEFILLVVGIAAAVVTLLWLIYWVYRARLLHREERRLMIERGITPPAAQPTGWPAVRAREQELKYEERRLRIEKGLAVPDDPANAPADYLRRGLFSLSLGLGLAGAYAVSLTSSIEASEETRNWFLFFGVISPAVSLYGVANVVYSRFSKRPQDNARATEPGPLR
jgi:hypothetical protein